MKNMTLSNFKEQLEKVIQKLHLELSANSSNPNIFYLENVKDLRIALLELEESSYFINELNPLKETVIYSLGSDLETLSTNQKDTLEVVLFNLRFRLANLLNLLNGFVLIQSEESINIKLPPIENLKDISKYTNDLHNAISQIVINDDIKGSEKVVSVENGSIWFNVLVGGGGVGLISSVVWAASAVYNFVLKCRISEEHLRTVSIQNDALQHIVDLNEAAIKRVIQTEAEYINSQAFKENEPENIEKIKNSIKTFADIIMKGGEVRPAINAPEDIKELFPSNPALIESKAIKKIENE
ncbi:hypothetical protein Q765_08100 [Flavobacterium rivuli WB 3.3-2 = DSM 21788]|uniref:Uncharacterized protein n=1 Tax=Flavobacterium rivuli WB 3.3-2 = DSM 21788 TaxID=1121895 RepID=A0A0A2M5M3_9FLAO|nr:hypothetical protein [Flavobacterium rivuli]KGO86921.1 hypothetical protein Q765_08100 [Flavobacterium rivuli WB 3.3-2 = DSM 21788]